MTVLEMFAWPRPASKLKSAIRLRNPVLQCESGKTKPLIVNGLKGVHPGHLKCILVKRIKLLLVN